MSLVPQFAEKVSVISLDLDDTLWDNVPVLEYAENTLYLWLQKELPVIAERYTIQGLKKHRKKLAAEMPEISHDMTRLRHESLTIICQESGYEKACATCAMNVFLRARNNVVLYDDVIPFLQQVSGKYHLVAMSNGNADVNSIGIGHYFDMVISPADAGTSKPDPVMFYGIFRKYSIGSDAVMHIGDEPETDVLGASGTGVYSVWLNRNNRTYPQHIPRPDTEINSLSQLINARQGFREAAI